MHWRGSKGRHLIAIKVALLTALICQAYGAPALIGEARWYGYDYIGRDAKDGSEYTGNDMTCAVNADMWNELGGARLLVCTDKQCIEVTVTDTGDAQAFTETNTVVDLSVRAFKALINLDDGVVAVRVWIVGF